MLDAHLAVQAAYLVSAVLFIFGLKQMAHPRTAVLGNLLGLGGMTLAVVATLLDVESGQPVVEGYVYVISGLVIGGLVGLILAIRVEMTAMPQLVALFNGFGGLASVLVAGAGLWLEADKKTGVLYGDVLLAIALSGTIGAVTFWGSLVAFAKLEEYAAFREPIRFPGQLFVNLGLLIVLFALAAILPVVPPWVAPVVYGIIVILATALGVMLVLPIGGADMPVVIALLNSYSGLAAAATGFVINNNILIISGSLVGASGVILTNLMCKAMNRSLIGVLFGIGETAATSGPGDDKLYEKVKRIDAESAALMLSDAQKVVFVPGYGMAVAQAQHAVKELANALAEHDVDVAYAIHPVAGRMPGHMNVLLAEADVPYDQLQELHEINPQFPDVDVAIVIGANDTVNPVAHEENNPISGMPVLDVGKARNVIVIKRSLSPGFAKIPNPLFAADNTYMLFADGKKAVLDMVSAIKEAN